MTRRTRRRLRRLKPILWLVVLVTGPLLLGAAVVGWQALHAKDDLQQARSSLDASRRALSAGDVTTARFALARASGDAHRALELTRNVVWTAYADVPLLGAPVREARDVVAITDEVTSQVLTPLVSYAPGQGGWTGRADLGALGRAADPLARADARLQGIRSSLAGVPTSGVGLLDDAKQQLGTSLDALASDVREAAVAAKVLPVLLGQDRPERLLLLAQNPDEERATGGLLGAFALLRTDQGAITTIRSGTDADLPDAAAPVVDLGPDFQTRYGVAQAAATWRSANLSPDLRSAGAILAGLSAKQLHTPVDGVVLVDPVALSMVLKATGPLPLPGLGQLSADNAVPLLLKDVYARFPADAQQQRKQALRQALDAVVQRLRQPVPGDALAHALARAAGTGHLQVYATDPALEADLVSSRVGAALPDRGPFLSLVTQDVGGSKLDYYLHRSVSYVGAPSAVAVDLGAGPETTEDAVITVRLTNDAPRSGLPAYVTSRPDDPAKAGSGQLKSWVSLYLGPRSTYTAATLDGRPVPLSSQVERGLTVLSTYVALDPGQTVTLVLRVQQPAAPGSALLWRQQPRLLGDTLVVRRAGAPVPYVTTYESD